MNENELNKENQAEEIEALTDLIVENEEQVKGSNNSNNMFIGGQNGNGVVLNHNETVESDENDTESLSDLEPEGEVKGGGGAMISKMIVDND